MLCAICASKWEIFAVLKVAKVSAAADMPKEMRSRKCLSLIMTSYSGRETNMLLKSLGQPQSCSFGIVRKFWWEFRVVVKN